MLEPTDLGLLTDLEPGFSQEPTVERLREWTAQRGRPLRVLHIGNIANNGYNNAKMLDAAGVHADVIAYDYYHIMGCPEWEDADIRGEIADDMNPDWWSVDLGGFERPPWFAQGPRSLCTRYLRSRFSDDETATSRAAQTLEASRYGHAQTAKSGTVGTLWYQRHRIPNAVAWRSNALAHRALAPLDARRRASIVAWAWRQSRSRWTQRIAHARWRAQRAVFFARRGLAGAPAEEVRSLPVWAPRRVHNAIAWRSRLAAARVRDTILGPQQIAEPAPTAADDVPQPEHTERHHDPAPTRGPRAILARRRADRDARIEAAHAELEWFDARCAELIHDFDERFPDRIDRLTPDDFATYRWALADWMETFAHYDLIEAYSTDPILAMIAGTRPYVAYEHGTIREIPFEDSAVGRLTALAYARADAVVITNPDCRAAAERLGCTDYRFIPHLIDRKYYDENSAVARPLPDGVREPYVFCPARQHWDVKGNDIALRAFARIAHDNEDMQLVISSWGPDVDKSRALLEELGVLDRVQMISPLRIRDLIAVTRRASVLIDQFHFAVFGGIGPTALACGTPLVTNLDHELSSWCMERPPYFHADDVASCTEALEAALRVDPAAHATEQLDWMQGNYWYGEVAVGHIAAYLDLLDRGAE
ncbi:MAG: glycosyltransferase [Actinomycetota bacterium]